MGSVFGVQILGGGPRNPEDLDRRKSLNEMGCVWGRGLGRERHCGSGGEGWCVLNGVQVVII
jgi:hypothetical protein